MHHSSKNKPQIAYKTPTGRKIVHNPAKNHGLSDQYTKEEIVKSQWVGRGRELFLIRYTDVFNKTMYRVVEMDEGRRIAHGESRDSKTAAESVFYRELKKLEKAVWGW